MGMWLNYRIGWLIICIFRKIRIASHLFGLKLTKYERGQRSGMDTIKYLISPRITMGKYQTHNRTSQTRAKVDLRKLNFNCICLSGGLYTTCANPEWGTGVQIPWKITELPRQQSMFGHYRRLAGGPMMVGF